MKRTKSYFPNNLSQSTGIALNQMELIINILENNEDTSLSRKKTLSAREKDILLRIFRDNETHQSVADSYGLTKERIRQLKELGLSKLRHEYNPEYYSVRKKEIT